MINFIQDRTLIFRIIIDIGVISASCCMNLIIVSTILPGKLYCSSNKNTEVSLSLDIRKWDFLLRAFHRKKLNLVRIIEIPLVTRLKYITYSLNIFDYFKFFISTRFNNISLSCSLSYACLIYWKFPIIETLKLIIICAI